LAIVRKRREEAEKLKASQPAPTTIRKPIVDDDDDDDDEDDDSEDEEEEGEVSKGVGSVSLKVSSAAATATVMPKLKSIDIKKMSGDVLKEHLKERKLDLQGQKKDLIKRLCDYEAAR
jgi:hypothetical protein